MLRDADLAMYRAKTLGKSRHEVFDSEMHRHMVVRLELETELRTVVERDELQVHYQPIVSLDDGGIVAFEALVRWQHPVHGFPTKFDERRLSTQRVAGPGHDVGRRHASGQCHTDGRVPRVHGVDRAQRRLNRPGTFVAVAAGLARAIADANMRMRVDEARHQYLACEVDDVGIIRRHRIGGSDRDDAPGADAHGAGVVRAARRVLRAEALLV